MRIDEKITDIIRSKETQLPTLPVIVDNILNVARSDRTSAGDLAEYINKDQAISNKILRLANSAYYGLVREVDTISRAITIVGFNEVVGLTIGMSIFSAFRQKDSQSMLNMKDLWIHSIGCAISSKEIAKRLKADVGEQIYLNGLLHDMGKVILSVYFPEEFGVVLEKARESRDSLCHVEKENLGIDHAALSGLLMERWRFPDSLILPCRYHHNSSDCPLDYRDHAMVIELADLLCLKAEIGHSGNHFLPKPEIPGEKNRLSSEDMKSIIQWLKAQREEIEGFFELLA